MENSATPEWGGCQGLCGIEKSVWAHLLPYRDVVIHIAFSGGVDSSALLNICARLAQRFSLNLRALHVNHGWSTEAARWEDFCRREACRAGIAFSSTRLTGEDSMVVKGEAEAREGRYRWLRDQVSEDGVLLTAHHGDDQAETLLFRLMRGASVNGLGSIRPLSEVADLTILRPLLGCSRQEILEYVQTRKLDYLIDPSNSNTAYDRNFLRHQVIPTFEKRWPRAKPILARTAQSLCEAQALLDEVALDDLARCKQVDHGCRFFVLDAISRKALLTLSERRQQNALRFWLRETGGITATEKALAEFIRQLQSGAAAPLMRFNGSRGPRSVRVFRNGVFMLPESESSTLAARPQTESWDGSNVTMNSVDVLLEARPVLGAGVRRDCIEGQNLEWRWRRGNTALRPANGSGRSRRLRILFQEMGIPPWERERMPMLFANGEFVCVPGLVIDQAFAASRDVPGVRLELSDLRSTGVRPVR